MAMFEIHAVDENIKALPTVDTASGVVASFDTDMTENLIEVVCEIVYSQAEGTPSPDNPLAIQTFSEMNVIHKGKNLIDDSLYYQAGANTVVIGQTLPNSNRTIFLKAGTYTIKAETSVAGSIYYDFGNGSTRIGSTSEVGIFTLENDSWCSFSLYKSGGFSPSDYTSVQLEMGNRATTYEAYNGNTYNIPFGQTVAKGTLNVTTGVLEITHSEYVFDGTETPIAYGSGYRYVVLTDKEGKSYGQDEIPNIVCNEYNAITRRQIQNGITGISITGNTILLSSDTPSGVQVVYELATPQVIQLDSKTLQSLLNENNIWCDTNGDTEVKYLLTVGKKIA